MTDIEIARNTKLKPITEIAQSIGIEYDELEQYGKYKAKINQKAIDRLDGKKDGKLILVTAMSPTKLGEGKTTVSISIADGLKKIGKNAKLAKLEYEVLDYDEKRDLSNKKSNMEKMFRFK